MSALCVSEPTTQPALTLLAQDKLLLLAVVVGPLSARGGHRETRVVGIVGLALGPVREGNIALVDPIEGGEIVLNRAQPDGQLHVSELD